MQGSSTLKIKNRLKSVAQGNSLTSQLLYGGIGSIALKAIKIALGLGQAILLARILGPAGYGVFAYVFALITILAIPAQFGLPALLIRETARGRADGNWGAVNGIWRWSAWVCCAISATLIIAALFTLWFWPNQFSRLQITTFFWGLALLPLLALSNLTGAMLRGLHYVVQGQLPESLVRPAIFIALIAAVGVLTQSLTANNAMMLRALASGCAVAAGVWLLLRKSGARSALQTSPIYESRAWLYSTLPLALTAGMQIITQQTDIIMLGFFESSETVGIYQVAVKGAMLIGFCLQAIASVVAPYYARMHRQGNTRQLQKLVTFSARGALALTLPIAIMFILFGEPILQLVFGGAYAPASVPLAILSVGWLLSTAFGAVGFLLIMTGYEKDSMRCAAVAAVTNIILNLILIPPFGMNGAALATACSLFLWKALLAYRVFTRTGLKAIASHKLAA